MESLKNKIEIQKNIIENYRKILDKVKERFPDTMELINEEIIELEAKYIEVRTISTNFRLYSESLCLHFSNADFYFKGLNLQ